MLDLLFRPISVMFDTDKILSDRLSYVLSTIVIVLFVNDYTGFTFNYKVRNQIGLIKELKEIGGADERLDKRISSLKNDVLNRKNIFEKVYGAYFIEVENPDAISGDKTTTVFNWRNLSASWVWIMYFSSLTIGLLVFTKFEYYDSQTVLRLSFMIFLFVSLGAIFIKILNSFTFENVHHNYLLNIIVNMVFDLLVGFLLIKRVDKQA